MIGYLTIVKALLRALWPVHLAAISRLIPILFMSSFGKGLTILAAAVFCCVYFSCVTYKD